MYSILILPSAERDLGHLPIHEFPRIKIKIDWLAYQPRPIGSEKLTGEDGYRIRVGDWRILYSFGPWEQIFYGEFDGRRHKRVLVKIIGE